MPLGDYITFKSLLRHNYPLRLSIGIVLCNKKWIDFYGIPQYLFFCKNPFMCW